MYMNIALIVAIETKCWGKYVCCVSISCQFIIFDINVHISEHFILTTITKLDK